MAVGSGQLMRQTKPLFFVCRTGPCGAQAAAPSSDRCFFPISCRKGQRESEVLAHPSRFPAPSEQGRPGPVASALEMVGPETPQRRLLDGASEESEACVR